MADDAVLLDLSNWEHLPEIEAYAAERGVDMQIWRLASATHRLRRPFFTEQAAEQYLAAYGPQFRSARMEGETSVNDHSYYEKWADRLNRVLGESVDFAFTPEWVQETEQLAGKPIAECSMEDFDQIITRLHAQAVIAEADADQFHADAQQFIAAMERRGAATMDDLFSMLRPEDDDYAELRAAWQRVSTRAYAEQEDEQEDEQ